LTVRAETQEDYPEVADVTTSAFGEEGEARMVEAIRASDAYAPDLSLVAELDGRIVGHVLLSYVGLTGDKRRLLELGPISVVPEHSERARYQSA
jgi:putative acetyltransferase